MYNDVEDEPVVAVDPGKPGGAKGFDHTVLQFKTTQRMRRMFEEKARPIPITGIMVEDAYK